MEKLIEVKGLDMPFRIKSINAKQSNLLIRKHTFLGQIYATGYLEDLVFACVDYPKFETKDALLESLLPGQFFDLSEQVQKLNGYAIKEERRRVK